MTTCLLLRRFSAVLNRSKVDACSWETDMTEFFEDKGTWLGHPVSVQGIFEDGECIAVKVLDRTDNTPISWAFNPTGSIGGDLLEGFRKLLQRLYDERKKEGAKA